MQQPNGPKRRGSEPCHNSVRILIPEYYQSSQVSGLK